MFYAQESNAALRIANKIYDGVLVDRWNVIIPSDGA